MAETEKQILLNRINNALLTVRPHLQADGGDVEVVDVSEDFQVQIRWLGMCESCSMSAMTLQAGISEAIRSKIPEIASVKAVN
jgi:Fe-S cluster biogenesis protein NfuA